MKSTGLLIIGLVLGSFIGAGSTFLALKPVSQKDFGELVNQVQSLETSLTRLDALEDNFEDFQRDMKSLEDGLEVVQYQIEIDSMDLDKLKAYSLMRKELGDPSDVLVDSIVDDIFSWVSSDSDANNWLSRASNEMIKEIISGAIESKVGKLVWYEYDTQYLSQDRYYVYMIADIPLSIETGIPIIGAITFSKYQVIVKGTVNTSWETVSDIEII